MNFQPKTKDDMVVTWDIMYQTSKEVLSSLTTRNIELSDPSLEEKLFKITKYFSSLKNEWIEYSIEEQKKIFLTYCQDTPENNEKFNNYLNLVCPPRQVAPKNYN